MAAKIELTPKQSLAFNTVLSGNASVIVFGGAIRGGKTFWLIITFFYLALQYPKSRWVIIRRTLPDLKKTTFPSFNAVLDKGFREKVQGWNGDIAGGGGVSAGTSSSAEGGRAGFVAEISQCWQSLGGECKKD